MVDSNRISKVYFALCKSVNTPVSLGCWLRYKYDQRQLVDLSINPSDYADATSFHRDYVCVNYLVKFAGLFTGIDTAEVALQKFKSSEEACTQTNRRFRSLFRDPTYQGCSSRVNTILFMASRKIASTLGPLTAEWMQLCAWGPGATATLSGGRSTLDNKIQRIISVTSTALPYMKSVLREDIHWLRSLGIPADAEACVLNPLFDIVEGCAVTTVPKSAKTDRTIALEPTANIFLQRGLGKLIRRRLRRVGIDLEDQSHNQRGARDAWRDNLMTVDLSAASDSISTLLVDHLLPPDWNRLVSDLRSPVAILPSGEKVTLSKVSSMGNGFTFDLETLIFWGLTSSCVDFLGLPAKVLVYGDDIIADRGCFTLLKEVFDFCGLTINVDKTYVSGQFFESCGEHYFAGQNVTPIYQKEPVDDDPSVYRCANRISRLALRAGLDIVRDATYLPAWQAATRGIIIGKHVVPLNSSDDDGLALDSDESANFCTTTCHGHRRYRVLAFQPRRRVLADHVALLAYALRFSPDEPFNGSVPLRRLGVYRSRYRRYVLERCDAPWV